MLNFRQTTVESLVDQCRRMALRARGMRPDQAPIAAFDADGTLWGPDVADLLWRFLTSGKLLHERAAAPLARAVRTLGLEPARDPYRDYETLGRLHSEGRCTAATMTRVMLQGLAGITEEDLYLHSLKALASATELQASHLVSAGKMLADLRAHGYRVIVVSGSPRWTVEVAVKPLGVKREDILAGEVAVVDGVLTDGVLDPLPYGRGKVQAILGRFGLVPRVAVGNGLADLAMLEATSHLRVLVNPSEDLVRACDGIRGTTWSMGLPDEHAAPRGRRGVPSRQPHAKEIRLAPGMATGSAPASGRLRRGH